MNTAPYTPHEVDCRDYSATENEYPRVAI